MLKRMLSIYSGYKKPVAKILALAFILNALSLIGPFFFGQMINSLHTKQSMWYSLALGSIGLVLAVIDRKVQYERHKIDYRETWFPIQEFVRMQTIDKYFAFSIGQHATKNSRVVQEIITSGEQAMQSLARTIIQNYLPMVIRCFVISIILLWFFPLLATILISGLTLYAFCQNRLEKKYAPLIKKRGDKNLASGKQRSELLHGVCLIKSFAQEVPMREKYRTRLRNATSFSKETNQYIHKWDSITSLLIDLTTTLITLTGIYLIFNSNFTVGDLVTVGLWCAKMSESFKTISNEYQDVLEQKEKVTRFFKLIDNPPAIREIEDPVWLKTVEGFIDFKNISFTYPPTLQQDEDIDEVIVEKKPPKTILHGVNFSIRASERVAIVGPSGSGKSTLIRLLLRGYDPTKGSISIDGYDLQKLSLREYYRHVAVVDQSSLMLDMSIRDNIQLGSQILLTDEAIIMLCKLMELDMDSFDSGLDTKVGQDGDKVSGGERQRLAIARALASNPRILILDEATASLDGIAEAKIQRAIDVASEGRTTIIIAHRLATVQHADRIFVLEDGRISAEGTHRELLRNSSLYMELVEKQKILT